MFETSRVRSIATNNRYPLLVASLVLHSLAAITIVAATIATVQFPGGSPRQMRAFQPMVMPTVPPAPRAQAPRQQAAVAQPQQRAETPREITAPPEIPDAIPQLQSEQPAGAVDGSVEGVGEPGGDPTGVVGGVGVGEPAEPLIASEPQVIHRAGGDVRPARVLTRIEPAYPEIMRRAGLRATVRVHCVVDKYGRVRDPQVVTSSYPPFNDAVLDAIRQWTFVPGSLRGTAVDTYFDLTVTFTVR